MPKIFRDENIKSYFNYQTKNEECNATNSVNEFFIDDQEWISLFEYIKENRINLNVRQVF